MKNKTLVTVVVASYHPEYEKLRRTIMSILTQKDIFFEIIVADDGSEDNFFEALEQLFHQYQFCEYKLLSSSQNMGTCLNIERGVAIASGKYIKTISPGDYLCNEYVLKEWTSFMEAAHIDVSFGAAVYYKENNGIFTILQRKQLPQGTSIYEKNQFRSKPAFLNYCFLSDAIVGALFLATKNILLKYLRLITYKVTYAEDNIYRIMLADNVPIYYFDRAVICYEYGTGISTSGDSKWANIIRNEYRITNNIICHHLDNKTWFCQKAVVLLNMHTNRNTYKILKYLFFPSLIFWKCRKMICVKYTCVDIDNTYIKRLYENTQLMFHIERKVRKW